MRSLDYMVSSYIGLLLFVSVACASGPTKVFINQVTEYSSLSSCAAHQVSTIVRDMENGCGDGGVTTSLSCFCYQSSTYFSNLISKSVAGHCKNGTQSQPQVSTALDVFAKYCSLGAEYYKTVTVSASETTSISNITTTTATSASPAATASQSYITTTSQSYTTTISSSNSSSSATQSPSKSSSSKSKTTAIAAGVAVPVGVILIALVIFFFWRRRRHQRSAMEKQTANAPGSSHNSRGDKMGSSGKGSESINATPAEMGTYIKLNELEDSRLMELEGSAPAEMEGCSRHAAKEVSSGCIPISRS